MVEELINAVIKQPTEKTQKQYCQANFQDLLAKITTLSDKKEVKKTVDSLRQLAEFLCYSEQYKLCYFDEMMASNVLLVDLPRILAMDSRLINIQLIQTVSILVQYIEDPGNLTVLLGADLIR